MAARQRRMTEGRSTPELPATRPGVRTALRILAPLLTLVVLIQAFFAGRGLFIDADAFDIHEGIANLIVLLIVAQTVLVFLAGFRGRARAILIGANVVLLALVIGQLFMGYEASDGNTDAAAWHVTNGVLIFGLSTGIASFLAFALPDVDGR